jgi:hypothetical protein
VSLQITGAQRGDASARRQSLATAALEAFSVLPTCYRAPFWRTRHDADQPAIDLPRRKPYVHCPPPDGQQSYRAERSVAMHHVRLGSPVSLLAALAITLIVAGVLLAVGTGGALPAGFFALATLAAVIGLLVWLKAQ